MGNQGLRRYLGDTEAATHEKVAKIGAGAETEKAQTAAKAQLGSTEMTTKAETNIAEGKRKSDWWNALLGLAGHLGTGLLNYLGTTQAEKIRGESGLAQAKATKESPEEQAAKEMRTMYGYLMGPGAGLTAWQAAQSDPRLVPRPAGTPYVPPPAIAPRNAKTGSLDEEALTRIILSAPQNADAKYFAERGVQPEDLQWFSRQYSPGISEGGADWSMLHPPLWLMRQIRDRDQKQAAKKIRAMGLAQ